MARNKKPLMRAIRVIREIRGSFYFSHPLPWNLWNDQVEELHRISGCGDRRGFRRAEIDPHTFGHIVKLVRIDECGVWHKTLLCLNPHAAVHPVPSQVVRCSVEDCGFESVWRLKFEIEQACFRGAKAMLGLGRNENQASGFDRASAFRRLDGALSFDDEIEVLAVLVEVER